MVSRTARWAYAGAQAARVAFYGAHYLVARVASRDAFAPVEVARYEFPSLRDTLNAMQALFVQDLANVEAGLYPLPLDLMREMRRARASFRYLSDVPRVAARRRRRGYNDVAARGDGLPHYYRQNFHFQTDGYLSDDSAGLYDFQVEALFAGTADAMRRRAYVPLAKWLETRDTARATLLDAGAGTGRFLSFVKSVQPRLKVIAVDLSEPYLERARRALRDRSATKFVKAPAEDMPLKDASVDAAVSIYLFHELPPRVRLAAAREIARVLKPGGLFVLADTIQFGDVPHCDGLIATFPDLLHEPYYDSFARSDLRKLFGKAGFSLVGTDIAYLTKISVFENKSAPNARRVRQ
jgi:ubiquinone/menaquinone biosynthesis C-methylase UbiE